LEPYSTGDLAVLRYFRSLRNVHLNLKARQSDTGICDKDVIGDHAAIAAVPGYIIVKPRSSSTLAGRYLTVSTAITKRSCNAPRVNFRFHSPGQCDRRRPAITVRVRTVVTSLPATFCTPPVSTSRHRPARSSNSHINTWTWVRARDALAVTSPPGGAASSSYTFEKYYRRSATAASRVIRHSSCPPPPRHRATSAACRAARYKRLLLRFVRDQRRLRVCYFVRRKNRRRFSAQL